MTGEFRTAKGWRIFIYIFSPLLIALFAYLSFIALSTGSADLTVNFILLPVSLGGIVIFAYGLAETMKGRIVIEQNAILRKGILATRTLYFQEIKGFRIDGKYVHIIPNHEDKKSIKLSSYMEQSGQVIGWLANNFINLDSQEAKEEKQQILANIEFGMNPQSREYRLNEATRVARYINFIGVATALWMWFYPIPYLISVSAGMILPVIALISIYFYRGLIRFDEKKNSAYPSIIYGFLAPSGALLARVVLDYEILEYENLWITVCIASVTLVCLFIVATKEIKFKTITDCFAILILTTMALCYSFGTYVMSNCLFDRSVPQIFKSEVVDKEIGSGKYATYYYLILEPWGPRTGTEKVSVTRDEFEASAKGDTVDVYLRQGLLKTPWFYVVTE